MLEVIRKILSKIFMNRIEQKTNQQLSQSQNAYRKSTSTTAVIWTHKWMPTRTQVQEIAIFITEIGMSSTFDTIYRDELFKIIEEFLDEDSL